ncbi:MAG: DUF885 domain-containing protein [Clostridiales bacterium]|nr:DUF885 domain-containing protein [Clostridiales bacterium]
MKSRKKIAAVVMSGVMSVSAVAGFAACGSSRSPEELDELALSLALNMMGDDVFAWNAYSVTPYETYGAVVSLPDQASWYSYGGGMSKNDISMVKYLFDMYYDELKTFDLSELSGSTAASYRSMDYILDTYRTYYSSKYVNEFELLGGSYISDEGGYVADFATSFENFTFRSEKDVKALLAVTRSTDSAFNTYLNFASDRKKAGYPLYDYTINAMQDYLDDVYEKGDEYYLYDVADNMIENANFLSKSQKEEYKAEYKSAIKNDYMQGVKRLSDGLNKYKGEVSTSNKSYLAAAGEAGKAYYEWLFRQKTGIRGANLVEVYTELANACAEFSGKRDKVLADVKALEQTDAATYNEFYEYYDGEKLLLGLSDPTEILDYLKVAAKDIVPDLKSTPEIGFKYMDDTVAEISNALAYYMRTPLDEDNSKEMITLNRFQIEEDPSDLLTTIAHEGYPGHLYAHVNAKESGTSLLSTCMSNSAFSEGWANYTELVLLENIAKAPTSSKATKMYCEYKRNYILYGYISSLAVDMQINYFGFTADVYKDDNPSAEDYSDGTDVIEIFMEIPAMYVPYGYGMYTMYTLHESAKSALGNKYNEVSFNGALLAEGFGPTLTRAKEITQEYIRKNK